MESPTDIAARVRMKAAHQALEDNLAELRSRRDGLRGEMLTLNRNTAGGDKRVKSLSEEMGRLEEDIRELRFRLEPLRAAHSERVGGALAASREAAARQLLDAIESVERNVAALNEVHAVIRAARGDAPPLVIDFRRLKFDLGFMVRGDQLSEAAPSGEVD